jgi:protein-serine/threonine kinase
MTLLKAQLEPTVVHRTQFKSRPSLISMDRGLTELTPPPEGSPSTSAESSNNSGKSSVPRSGELTGKTSLFDSKYSQKSKIASQHSSENKKLLSKQATPEGGSNENSLTPIAEVEAPDDPEPTPSEYPEQH